MTLTPEQIAEGWIEWNGGECPIKDARTTLEVEWSNGKSSVSSGWDCAYLWTTGGPFHVRAYRIIEAHGADVEPARPTPFPASYDDLVFDDAGWSQTIIVDGKRPEWLRDDDRCCESISRASFRWLESSRFSDVLAIRVRRREPKRETVTGWLCHVPAHVGATRVSYDLIDGKPDLSTLKIAEDAE